MAASGEKPMAIDIVTAQGVEQFFVKPQRSLR